MKQTFKATTKTIAPSAHFVSYTSRGAYVTKHTNRASEPGFSLCEAEITIQDRELCQRGSRDKQGLGRKGYLAAGQDLFEGQVPNVDIPTIPDKGQNDAGSDTDTEGLQNSASAIIITQ